MQSNEQETAAPAAPPCWCRRCDDAARGQPPANPREYFVWLRSSPFRFIVCPVCGNKRCPRAAYHGHACTGSNERGQPGSDYP